ncbi:MAG: LysE family transporter [Methanomassiliicoccales archaeon]|jgi:chemosensory pili system protein ChpE
MTLAAILLTALALSMLYSIAPDAVNTEALRRSFSGGFHRGMMVELGSVVGDVVWAVLAMAGFAVIIGTGYVQTGIGIIGCVLLTFLAWGALKDAKVEALPEGCGKHKRGDFVTGALISLSNPLALVFWVSIGGIMIEMLAAGGEAYQYIVFFSGFMIGVLSWCFIFPWAIERSRKYVSMKTFRAINALCAVLMLGLALEMFVKLVLW